MRAHDHRPSDNEQAVRARTATSEPAPEQAQIMRMQQGAGNQAVASMLARKTLPDNKETASDQASGTDNKETASDQAPGTDNKDAMPDGASADNASAGETPAPDTQAVEPGEMQDTAPDEPAAAEEMNAN